MVNSIMEDTLKKKKGLIKETGGTRKPGTNTGPYSS